MSARHRAAHDSRLYTIAVAVVAWFGVALQCYLSLHLAAHNGHSLLDGLVIFLGYFTVLTNRVYPYGFIDVSMIGYAQTAINAIALLGGFIVLGFLFVGVNRVCVRAAT